MIIHFDYYFGIIIPTYRALLVLPIITWVTHWSMGNTSVSGTPSSKAISYL